MQPKESNALIVVAKQPAPGRTKTRLSPPMSPDQASALYACFLLDTLEQIRQVSGIDRVIAYLPVEAHGHFRELAPDFQLIEQEGADLGARLDNALTSCLSRGYKQVAIMNSDSPTLPPSCLAGAFEALSDGADVALGPCDDGGYYLIGTKRPIPRLLREVRMSTPTVASDTLALAEAEGLRVRLLPTWYDVDDAASLARLVREVPQLEERVAAHTRRYLDNHLIHGLLDGDG